MNLIETSSPAVAALPLRAFADHLMLGSCFADDGMQDALLEGYLRAAIASIEARIGKVILNKTYTWDLTRWFSVDRQGLPVGPISTLDSVTLITRDGSETVLDPSSYGLKRDLFRPELVAPALPAIPSAGLARIAFTAGFGADWTSVPPNLAQAVMVLAAGNYESRDRGFGATATLPFGVLSLIEPYKTVRMLGDVL